MKFILYTSLFALAASGRMSISKLKPEYAYQDVDALAQSTAGSNFVFLQRFPLEGEDPFFYHTEVLVCPRSGFSAEDQKFLDDSIAGFGKKGFKEIKRSWWNKRGANCVQLGYVGNNGTAACSGVKKDTAYQLNFTRSTFQCKKWIVEKEKDLYIYGTGSFDGNVAWHNTCDRPCWSSWSGKKYNRVIRNCNTFTSTVLFMVYGLSQKKPWLGVSDFVRVKGRCPKTTDPVA